MSIQIFSWVINCTVLVCKLCFLFQTILDLWPLLILEIFICWNIKKGQFEYLVTFLAVFFLVGKLCKSGLYIITYFEHGQCFILGFLVFSFLVFNFIKTFVTQEMVGRRKLPDPLLNLLKIGFQKVRTCILVA